MSTRMIYYAFCVKARPYSLSEIRTIDKAKKKTRTTCILRFLVENLVIEI